MPDRAASTGGVPARVWDLPIRLVHWLLALLIPFSWWAAKFDHLPWHRLSGYTILGLLIFRVIWGVFGSPTARFSRFVRGPRSIGAYLTGRLGSVVGHNPLGGWSVIAMLTVLGAQVGLGLFAVDEDSLEPGPLSKFVSFDTGRAIAHLHHRLFGVLLALIALHIAAIAAYAIRRRNLVGPMLTGRARLAPGVEAPPLVHPWRVIPAAAVAFLVAWVVAHGLRV